MDGAGRAVAGAEPNVPDLPDVQFLRLENCRRLTFSFVEEPSKHNMTALLTALEGCMHRAHMSHINCRRTLFVCKSLLCVVAWHANAAVEPAFV